MTETTPGVTYVLAPTEERNPRTVRIDTVTTLELMTLINDEDAVVPEAVRRVLPVLAEVVDVAVDRVRRGGTIHYFGAGTAGRMAVIDAAELLPTFDSPEGLVVAHHAGGAAALTRAEENVEDAAEAGARATDSLSAADVAIGLTASGRTPYVGGALARARELGAATVLVTANPQADLSAVADYLVAPGTGPEAIAGSTRLKAGTAQKLVLHTFSTALMVRLGRTYSNLMTSVVPTNAKLRGRVHRILQEATGEPLERCRETLHTCAGELPTALVVLVSGASPQRAREALTASYGSVRGALDHLDGRGEGAGR
jgi:N-acetylmuramic acid 6-phosphate etherase